MERTEAKKIVGQLFSRKSSIAAIGIVALCYMATVTPGSLQITEGAGPQLLPMPTGPAAVEPLEIDRRIPLYITIITCLAIVIQGGLDYFRPRCESGQTIELGLGTCPREPTVVDTPEPPVRPHHPSDAGPP